MVDDINYGMIQPPVYTLLLKKKKTKQVNVTKIISDNNKSNKLTFLQILEDNNKKIKIDKLKY